MAAIRLAAASSMLLLKAAALTINGNECPQGWSMTQLGSSDKVYCCYGSSTIHNEDGYCCVHSSSIIVSGAGSGGDPVDDITKSCFPFCTATTTGSSSGSGKRAAFPSPQCVDKVPFTASDYSERVSAASKSAEASQTGSAQPSSNSAEATATSGSSKSGADSTAAASKGSSASSSGSAGSTNNAAPAVTQGVMQLGGLVAAAAMLVA
ncbi:hypothetical protein NLG97_g6275 [Lecanicillium saksenae]|uniref:Uncharacterized protein n=1 Tax=Lecanicillium saksenae TaxID=468837 RepID=A0ACC1QSN3_9HYPO|nr:hypothetical protein NLG97_g6275 [Lecanicillium saksenae]